MDLPDAGCIHPKGGEWREDARRPGDTVETDNLAIAVEGGDLQG